MYTCSDFIIIARITEFSGVKSDGGKPSVGSTIAVTLKSIFIGAPGTNGGNCFIKYAIYNLKGTLT